MTTTKAMRGTALEWMPINYGMPDRNELLCVDTRVVDGPFNDRHCPTIYFHPDSGMFYRRTVWAPGDVLLEVGRPITKEA